MNCPPWIPLSVGYSLNDTQRLIMTEYPILLFPSGCIEQLPAFGRRHNGGKWIESRMGQRKLAA